MITVLIPAHNEGLQIADTVASLRRQTRPTDRIVVVSDNSTDDTATAARAAGAGTMLTIGNTAAKAGALNQALNVILPGLEDNDLVLVQDADSILSETFVETTLEHLLNDPELTFALLHLGYKVKSPPECYLVTEVMKTWKDLWRQRLRWKRGAVENCFQYGLTKVTWRYWGRQLLTATGVAVTIAYISSLIWSLAVFGSIYIMPFWLAITGIFVTERVVTIRFRGWKHMLATATCTNSPSTCSCRSYSQRHTRMP